MGRCSEVNRMIQILCRRRKNTPLLVGESGVGKTAIVEGFAGLIVEKKVPKVLEHSIVFKLDLGQLLAGAKFRGEKNLTLYRKQFFLSMKFIRLLALAQLAVVH